MSESEREERIRRRAFERYEQRGGEPGRDTEDWLAAEQEEDEQPDSTQHGRGGISDPALAGRPTAGGDPPLTKDEKINEASKESFPASDAPAWRGGAAR